MRMRPILAMMAVAVAGATTLQLLTTDQMIQQSSAIVRVKVTGSAPVLCGRDIYTAYQLSLIETLKAPQNGSATTLNSVSLPGGVMKGVRQTVAGAPSLMTGQEYVIFLWTSRSGLTQIIGLSQGVFNVLQDGSANPVLVRAGQGTDSAVSMKLGDLKAEIQKVGN
jgi:hypothetical protein